MLAIYPSPTVVATGNTPVAIIDFSTRIVEGGNADSESLSLDVTAPSGCNVSLTLGVRFAYGGRVIALPRFGTPSMPDYLKDGTYPIPAGTSASFVFPLPRGIDSVVVYATHDALTSKTITAGGSLAEA